MGPCSNFPHKPTHVFSFTLYVPLRRTLVRTLISMLMVIWCEGSSIKQSVPQLALSLRQHYTQSQMLEQFNCLAYLGETVAPTSVFARCPTLPGASVSVKKGVVKKSTLVWRCTVTLPYISFCSKLGYQYEICTKCRKPKWQNSSTIFYDRNRAMRSAVGDISVLMKCLMTSSRLRTINDCGDLVGSIPWYVFERFHIQNSVRRQPTSTMVFRPFPQVLHTNAVINSHTVQVVFF